MSIEKTIFDNLVYNEEYTRKVSPFLKEEYFSDHSDKIVFNVIIDYFNKYNSLPSLTTLLIDLENRTGVTELAFKECKEKIESIKESTNDLKWLVDTTEKFCQERAIYNAIYKSISIIDDKTSKLDKGSIPDILSQAIGVSFDNSIGHDFLEDFNERFEYYHRVEERIPFDIDLMNKITNGGLPKKTLNMILAGTHVGKTLAMCHMASYNLLCAKNVLYITLEMAEEEISRRIDCNLLNIPIIEMDTIPKDIFDARIEKVKSKSKGKLIVKEYPTASAGAANFRHLLNELKIKKNFIPDIIYIDYINICMSSRLKMGANINSYTLIKAIAEELRGLAVEFELPIVSATQTNREGFANSDLELTDTSESFGLPMTVDFMIGLHSSEELKALAQVLVKQLKNRYTDKDLLPRFVVGIDKSYMRWFNTESSAQDGLLGVPKQDDKPVMDKGKFFTEDNDRTAKKFKKGSFNDFT